MLDLIERSGTQQLSQAERVRNFLYLVSSFLKINKIILKALIVRGPSEKDIVYSGLDDTMSQAVAETIACANEKVSFF